MSADLTWDVFDNGDSFGVLKVGVSAIERDRIAEAAIYGYSTILAGDVVAAGNASVSDVIYACGCDTYQLITTLSGRCAGCRRRRHRHRRCRRHHQRCHYC